MPCNIILIMADQFRGDAINNPDVQTPNLNYLAARGTNFSRAYTPCPSCIPGRAMLWTGMSQWHTGILSMSADQPEMPNDYPHTMAAEFTRAGYQTHLSGKAHFWPQDALNGFQTAEVDEAGRVESPGFKDAYRAWFEKHAPTGVTPDDHGIDFNSWCAREWHLPEYLHPTAWTMTSAIDFLKRRDKNKPFFLNISFDRPHSPYVPPRPYWEMYYNRQTPSPPVGDWAHINDKPQSDDAKDPNATKAKLSPYQIHRARSGYCGEISFVDAQVGRLMTFLRRYQPETRGNTVFVFVSDHGDLQGDHHMWRKGQPYEGSARIPLIILPPASQKASRPVADEPVSLMDVMPTLLDFAGIQAPPTVEGRSLAPLTRGAEKTFRSYLHGEHGHMHYVTDGRQKFIWFPYESREQFFDLESDPAECQNLIGDPLRQKEIGRWRDRLIKELAQRDCGWVKDGKLHYPGAPLISPYKTKRWQGTN